MSGNDNRTPDAFDRLEKVATAIGLPAITVAIMYYFGWVRTARAASEIGVPETLFSMSVSDYVLRGAAPVIPIVTIVVAWFVVAAIVYWFAETRDVGRGRRARGVVGVIGLALLVGSLGALIEGAPTVGRLTTLGLLVVLGGVMFWSAVNGERAQDPSLEGIRALSRVVLGAALVLGLFTVVRAEAARDGAASIEAFGARIADGSEPRATLSLIGPAPVLRGASATTISVDTNDPSAGLLTELRDVYVLHESGGRLIVVSSCFAHRRDDAVVADVVVIDAASVERMRFGDDPTQETVATDCSWLEAVETPVRDISDIERVVADGDGEVEILVGALTDASQAIDTMASRVIDTGDDALIERLENTKEEIAGLLATIGEVASDDDATAVASAIDALAAIETELEQLEAARDAEQAAALAALEEQRRRVADKEDELAQAKQDGAPPDEVEMIEDELAEEEDELDERSDEVKPACTADVVGGSIVITWDLDTVDRVVRGFGDGGPPETFDPQQRRATDGAPGSGTFSYEVFAGEVSDVCSVTVKADEPKLDPGGEEAFCPDGVVPDGPTIIPVDRGVVSGGAFGFPGTTAYCGPAGGPVFREGIDIEVDGVDWVIIPDDAVQVFPGLGINDPIVTVDLTDVSGITDALAEELSTIDSDQLPEGLQPVDE